MPPRAVRAYGLAVVSAVSSVALTAVAWPVFGPTPYAPTFGAVAAATHWGSPGAGLLAIVLSVGGAFLAFPTSGSYPWHAKSAAVFVLISLIGNRIIAARDRTAAALHDREAQLRATLDEVRTSAERLRHAQKLEAAGQLAAGIAHNFNNLLTVTMVYVDVLSEDFADPKLREQALQEIRRATERGASLTRQLLAFSGKHAPQPTCVQVDRAVDAMREMLRRLVPEDIFLTLDFGWEPAAVTIDLHDLEQVVLNLIINARDAVPPGGSIQVRVSRETIASGDARLGDAAEPGDFVRVSVRDNGVGMTPEEQSRLFEPFFTTKGRKGTGVGLTVVNEIAKHAGGFVAVETAPGHGTSVSVFMRAAPSEADADTDRSSGTAALPSGTSMILLVEDMDNVRESTAWILRRAGHRVLPAASPVEAIALFRMYARDIDLLVTDIVMPDMDGPALAAELLAERPNLSVLYVSAYPDALPRRESAAATGFLAKPFSGAQLLAAIAALHTPRS